MLFSVVNVASIDDSVKNELFHVWNDEYNCSFMKVGMVVLIEESLLGLLVTDIYKRHQSGL